MPSRGWGAVRAYIWELSEISNVGGGSPFSYGGVSTLTNVVPDSVEWRRTLSAVGNGRATFYASTYWEQYLVAGRVCVVEQVMTGYGGVARTLAVFLMETVEPMTNGDGLGVVVVSGPGVEHLLSKKILWTPIGAETILDRVLSEEAHAPTSTTTTGTVDAFDDTVTLASFTNVDVDDFIRVQMDNDEWHTSRIIALNPTDTQPNTVQVADPFPVLVTSGGAAVVLTAKIGLDSVENLAVDQVVYIYRAGGLYTESRVIDVRAPKSRVVIEHPLEYGSAVGSDVVFFDYNAPTSSDVTQIMAFAPEWDVDFQTGTGTETGTAHKPDGESILDLLSVISDRTGEFWRYEVSAVGVPTYKIKWLRTPESTGFDLIMYDDVDYARQITDELDIDKGAIFSLRRQKTRQLITRVYPRPGSGVLSLSECSGDALTLAALDGFTIHIADYKYDRDYIELGSLVTEFGEHSVQEVYGDIAIDDTMNQLGRTAAADQMLAAAKWTIQQANYRNFYTVECFTPKLLAPGQYVTIENASGTTPVVNFANTYIVLEATESLVDGRPRTTLHVSDLTGIRRTAAMGAAQTIRSVIQTTRRLGAAAGNAATDRSLGIVTGGGGASDHGDLTGLSDDDHPQYLRTDGTRTLVGNMAAAAGVTIDGVDLSAHAANPAAHHDPVTAADGSITVSGQTIRVANAIAGDGLAISTGVLSVKVSTSLGTSIVSDTVAVQTDANGGLVSGASGLYVKLPSAAGLSADATGLQVKLPASSGLGKDSGGLFLSPSTLTAATTNALSGAGHTHAVTATDNAKTTVGTLLKGSAAGDVAVRWATADKVVTPIVETASGALTLNPAAGKTINDGDLEFTGARSITTDTGSLTLAPAQTLVLDPTDDVARVAATTTLRSTHAAVGVFPQTGWQIDYDGHGYFTSLLADELIVQSFIADLMRVKVGGEYIPESMALLRRDFTVPAVGATATLYVEDIPGWADIATFADNDWVMIRIVDRSGGGLIVAAAWGQVTGYTDRTEGEQSWTFTTRVATAAVGKTAHAGDVVLDYGKVGSSWYYVTVTDPGGPHAGFASWYGASPADNPEYWLRMGQLKGISGRYERGFQTGLSNSSFTRLSELGNEIHGSRLSLYAGDGGKLQLSAVDVVFYRTAGASSTLVPDGDGTAVNVDSTTAAYYTAIDEGAATPNHNDYIANKGNLSGMVFLSLTNPAAFTSIHRIDIVAAVKSTGLVNDTARLYGQVFENDEATPLTGEVLLVTRTTNVTGTVTVTAPHTGYGTGGAGTSDWSGARLRLRWEYDINANEEAIRLDPAVPSLAVGNPLPTGMTTGGAGLWAGLDSGAYKARIGDPLGARITYDGNGLQLVSGSTGAQIVLNPTAQSIALGNPLPTGTQTGGAGFWVGLLSGSDYGLRIGGAINAGPQLLYDGASNSLALRKTDGTAVLAFLGDGSSYFAGPMTIGTTGGIYQGTGTFASPTNGLKIYNSGGQGYLSTYSAGSPQVTLRYDRGVEFVGSSIASPSALTFAKTAGGVVFGRLVAYSSGGSSISKLYITDGANEAGVELETVTAGETAKLFGGTTSLTLSSANDYALLSNADLYIRESGIAVGYTSTPALNRGQIASDLAGEHDYNALVLQDTGDIAHGITSLVSTATYGALSKYDADAGGLRVLGVSEDVRGLVLMGIGTGYSQSEGTGSGAPVMINAAVRSGTTANVATLGNDDNALVVRNNGLTQFIVKGDGNFYYNGVGAAYDEYDDPALLATLNREVWGGAIDSEWHRFISYNRQSLIDAGIMSDGGFVNGAALNRLLVGAIGQLAARLNRLEGNSG